MYHSRWKGSPYEAGLHYGSLILSKGHSMKPPFPITAERREFSRLCLPIYEEFAPHIVEELRGFAEGQRLPEEDILIPLFSMYCFTFDVHCSAFAFRADGGVFFGRNSDFLLSAEKLCDSALYRMDGGYGFIGNTTALTQMEDGINEHGLAAGLTMVYPLSVQPGLNAGMLVRLVLEKCRTVGGALDLLRQVPAASSHNILLADKSGDMALVQACCHRAVTLHPERGALFTANHFTAKEMQPYQYMGPDDIFSHVRCDTLRKAFEGKIEEPLAFCQSLLRGERGFLCQYDRSLGFGTIWSSIYDPAQNKIYRAEGSPERRPYLEDTRMR